MNLGLDREVTAVSRSVDGDPRTLFSSEEADIVTRSGFVLMFQINLHFFGCHTSFTVRGKYLCCRSDHIISQEL